MICLSERKLSVHQNYGLIQLPEISKSSELLKLNNSALKSSKIKKQTKPQSPNQDIYYLKLPSINKKVLDQTDNFFKLSKSQIQTQKILQGDTSLDNINKYNKKIQDIQHKHNQYINKIEELYMVTKQQFS